MSERDKLIDLSVDFTRAIRMKAIEDYFKCSFKDVESAIKLQELIKDMDISTIIQFLKEYGFAICSTSECRNKVAEQHDKLIKLRSLVENSEK